jgi:protein TonB
MAGVVGGVAGGVPGGAMGGVLGGIVGSSLPPPKVAPPQKIRVSSGVVAGNKISGANPSYPAIARTARIQGTVVLQATISKQGTIIGLHAVSGPPMLYQAALDAVQQWRYKPYILNGDAVEVETTIQVNFTLNGG